MSINYMELLRSMVHIFHFLTFDLKGTSEVKTFLFYEYHNNNRAAFDKSRLKNISPNLFFGLVTGMAHFWTIERPVAISTNQIF